MKLSLIAEHLESKRTQATRSIAILFFKPDFPSSETEGFEGYCRTENLTVRTTQSIQLTPEAVYALYPKIYTYSPNDLKFGIDWKTKLLDYLISGPCLCTIVEGEDAQEKLERYKTEIRTRHRKIIRPQTPVSPEEFVELVIKNLVHVVDEDEIQNALWVLPA